MAKKRFRKISGTFTYKGKTYVAGDEFTAEENDISPTFRDTIVEIKNKQIVKTEKEKRMEQRALKRSGKMTRNQKAVDTGDSGKEE